GYFPRGGGGRTGRRGWRRNRYRLVRQTGKLPQAHRGLCRGRRVHSPANADNAAHVVGPRSGLSVGKTARGPRALTTGRSVRAAVVELGAGPSLVPEGPMGTGAGTRRSAARRAHLSSRF